MSCTKLIGSRCCGVRLRSYRKLKPTILPVSHRYNFWAMPARRHWLWIVTVKFAVQPLESGRSPAMRSFLSQNSVLSVFLWPLPWSSGQSSWLQSGDLLCFLWGTNWIYIFYVEESRSEFLATQRRCIVFAVRYELNLYILCRRK
jgi:hypothetical protein